MTKTPEYWCREIAKNFGKVIGEPTLNDAFFERAENKPQLAKFVEVIAPIIIEIQRDAAMPNNADSSQPTSTI